MAEWSRRDVLRAGASAAALAVPMAALSASPAWAGRPRSEGPAGDGAALGADEVVALGAGPVMFSVLDASRGQVAIYHGRNEVVVQDRALVARIVRAANAATSSSVG